VYVALRAAKCQSGRSPSIPTRTTITTMIPWMRGTIRRTRPRPCHLDFWARPCGSTSISVNRYPVRKQDHLAQSLSLCWTACRVGADPRLTHHRILLFSSHASCTSVCTTSGIRSYSSASLYPPFSSCFLHVILFLLVSPSSAPSVFFEIESGRSIAYKSRSIELFFAREIDKVSRNGNFTRR